MKPKSPPPSDPSLEKKVPNPLYLSVSDPLYVSSPGNALASSWWLWEGLECMLVGLPPADCHWNYRKGVVLHALRWQSVLVLRLEETGERLSFAAKNVVLSLRPLVAAMMLSGCGALKSKNCRRNVRYLAFSNSSQAYVRGDHSNIENDGGDDDAREEIRLFLDSDEEGAR